MTTDRVQENKAVQVILTADTGVLTLQCGSPSVTESPVSDDGTEASAGVVFTDSHGRYMPFAFPGDPVAGIRRRTRCRGHKKSMHDRARGGMQKPRSCLPCPRLYGETGGETEGILLSSGRITGAFSGEWPEYEISPSVMWDCGGTTSPPGIPTRVCHGRGNGVGVCRQLLLPTDPVFSGYIGV